MSMIAPPPVPVGAEGDWAAAEARLGTPFPSDYREFVRRYGEGHLAGFIGVLAPFATNPYANIFDRAEQLRATELEFARCGLPTFQQESQFALFPQPGGLLQVALTDNGDTIYWLTVGTPDEWVIIVNGSRMPVYERFECSLTEFLAGIVSSEIQTNAFPAFSKEARFSFRSDPER